MSEPEAWVKTCGKSPAEAYHTDPDCRQLGTAVDRRPISDGEIDRRGLDVCSYCAGTCKSVQPETPTLAMRVNGKYGEGDD